QEDEREQRADAPDERPGCVVAALAAVLRQDGDERLRERAFGEQAPQEVGQPERGLEGVHRQSSAEGRRLEALARKTGNAGQQRHAADRSERFEEVHVRGSAEQRLCPARGGRVARMRKIAYYARSLFAPPFQTSASGILMANTAQTRKRARQAEATRMRNASLKSALRSAVK